jgi:hypothetical protein
MTSLNNFVIANDETGLARFAFLMQALTDEVIEELTEKDEDTIGGFMSQMGEVIAWIGHGDKSRLPDSLRAFAEIIQPSDAEVIRDDSGADGRSQLREDSVFVS